MVACGKFVRLILIAFFWPFHAICSPYESVLICLELKYKRRAKCPFILGFFFNEQNGVFWPQVIYCDFSHMNLHKNCIFAERNSMCAEKRGRYSKRSSVCILMSPVSITKFTYSDTHTLFAVVYMNVRKFHALRLLQRTRQ